MQKTPYIENFDQWKDEFTFSIDIPIRFSETDMFGHVNNASAFIYFEEARIAYLKELGLFNSLDNGDSIPVVADIQCDFFKEMFFGETIEVFVKTSYIGTSSVDIHYLATSKEDHSVCLTGRGRLVNVDPLTGKPVALTSLQKRKLSHRSMR